MVVFLSYNLRLRDYIDGDLTLWEREPLEALAADGQLDRLPARRFLAVHGYTPGCHFA